MEITKRPVQKGDAGLANDWLEGWKLNRLPETMYPSTGVVLENEEQPVFMGFIWESNSKMAMLGFITRNPFVRKLPKGILKNLIHEMIYECRQMGYEHIISWAANKAIVQAMRELGMVETSDKCSEMIIYKLTD